MSDKIFMNKDIFHIGIVRKEAAKRDRKCKCCEALIPKGEECLLCEFFGLRYNEPNYQHRSACAVCSVEILKKKAEIALDRVSTCTSHAERYDRMRLEFMEARNAKKEEFKEQMASLEKCKDGKYRPAKEPKDRRRSKSSPARG